MNGENLEKKTIFISGIDGSGKTTLAKTLVKKLRKNGADAKYVWYRWSAFFSYPLLLLCRILGLTQKKGNFIARKYYRNKAISVLWSFLYPLDYSFCSLIKLKTLRENDIIVFDRFLPDIIVDVTFQAQIDVLNNFIGRFLLAFLERKNFLGIILDVDEETAISRKDDIPSRKYVESRRPIYLNLANVMGWKVLGGSRPPEENTKEILKMIRVDPSE